MSMNKQTCPDSKHIDVVDGIRAISVMIVVIFHFWQQTWIDPIIKTPWLSFIKTNGKALTQIDFSVYARAGYVFVDMLVLLSGFLISLPLIGCLLCGETMESASRFYRKRAARILPSYLFFIVICFIYEVINGGYNDGSGAFDTAYSLRDLITHLTFTHMLRTETYMGTKLNPVLWTLAVEVWFYMLFPLICKLIKLCSVSKDDDKHIDRSKAFAVVLASSVIMIGLSHLYIYKYVLAYGTDLAKFTDGLSTRLGCSISSEYLSSAINQLPAFLGVYAIGLLGAMLYTFCAKRIKRSIGLSAVSTVFAFTAIVIVSNLVRNCAYSYTPEKWQVTERLSLSCVFMFFIISSAFSARWFRFVLSNRIMRFLSAISYNLYIWHQWLAVKIKYDFRIPFWQGSVPPNQLMDNEWSAKYAVIITIAAFAVAIITTYLIEKPFSALILGKQQTGIFAFTNKKRSDTE